LNTVHRLRFAQGPSCSLLGEDGGETFSFAGDDGGDGSDIMQ